MARAARPLAQRGIRVGDGGRRGVGGALVVSYGRGLHPKRPLRVAQLSEPAHRVPGSLLSCDSESFACQSGNRRAPRRAQKPLTPSALATPTPALLSLLFPDSCERLRLQHPLPCFNCSHLGPAFEPLTPSTSIPGPSRPLYTLHSVSVPAFAR